MERIPYFFCSMPSYSTPFPPLFFFIEKQNVGAFTTVHLSAHHLSPMLECMLYEGRDFVSFTALSPASRTILTIGTNYMFAIT